ncbi:hypothetical protein [Streptomyces sp. NBC_00829]|uniref:hypothetical protein n=1 Tax=Streptomyces sp. NBC_00829 TaxID=2903679 RepID=UPI0038642FF2|nr:hypothetical protein OG293_34125 [Streptomyces sp. NBC_00829]
MRPSRTRLPDSGSSVFRPARVSGHGEAAGGSPGAAAGALRAQSGGRGSCEAVAQAGAVDTAGEPAVVAALPRA